MELRAVGEKALHLAADPALLAYCPSMELLALGTIDHQVLIYRPNGQRVYGATQKGSSLHVNRIRWKPNGQLLAIAWSDGVVRLLGAESNKPIHQISTATSDQTGITCLDWSSNLVKRVGGQQPFNSELFLENLARGNLDIGGSLGLDLPRDLALIDVELSLPKLSTLPAGGTSEDIFSSRGSLDGLFRAFDPKDNDTVDVMVVGTEDGRIHLSIYDSFVVGSFPSPVASSKASNYHLCLHASHKCYSTHALLMKATSSLVGGIYYVPMDLRFVSTSRGYLSLLASRSTALQNLLRYIHQVQNLMVAEWQATQDLPSKFLRNINETLIESNGCDIVQAMYHSVATGHTFPVVKEWLVDELAERGHKRWDKAVSTGLENIRRLVHEDMLPALERCTVILSRLSGIAKYQSSNDIMGFSSHQISLIMDTVLCLNLVASRIMTYVVDEIELFAAFSTWLRHEIDRLASDSSASPAEDNPDKEILIDHNKVLLYIRTGMTTSRLSAFFQDLSSENVENDWGSVDQGLPKFDLLDKQLQNHELGLPYLKALPKINLLCEHLEKQASTVFQQIAESEKRNVMFGRPISIRSMSGDGPIAMRICPEGENICSTYIAIASSTQARSKPRVVRISRVLTKIENGISSQISMTEILLETRAGLFHLPEGSISDITFLDDYRLLLLCLSPDHVPSLLSIPYTTAFINSETPQSVDKISQFLLPDDVTFVPDKLEVSQHTIEEGTESQPRLCILSKDRLHYKVFQIPKADPAGILSVEDAIMA